MAAGFLFKSESITYQEGLFILGIAVIVVSFASFLIRFSAIDELANKTEVEDSIGKRELAPVPVMAMESKQTIAAPLEEEVV